MNTIVGTAMGRSYIMFVLEPGNLHKLQHNCPECRSTLEQLGIITAGPVSTAFCPQCGCAFGVVPAISKAAASEL